VQKNSPKPIDTSGIPRPFASAMAHLKQETLSEDMRKALIECGNRLENASFRDNGKFEAMDDEKMLKEAIQVYVKLQSGKVSIQYLI